ncbi:MAG: hypothetical protein ACSLFP_11150 [Acidimicrobiales bacterium]
MSPRPPADAVVALRSLPRRFRALFAGLGDDESPDDLAHRVGGAGRSAADHIVAARSDLTFFGRAVEQVLTDDEPALHPALDDATQRDWPDAAGAIHERLDELSETAEALAQRLEHVGASQWARRGTVASGGLELSAADLVWRGVDSALEHRQAAEQVLGEVRRQR